MIAIKNLNLNIILPAALLAALLPTDNAAAAPAAPPVDELEWYPENLGGKRMTHREAIKAVEELGDGWRLASDKEWEAEIDRSKFKPALRDASKFPGIVSEAYWTSALDPSVPEYYAFIVGLSNGYVGLLYRLSTAWVRPCRVRRAPSQ